MGEEKQMRYPYEVLFSIDDTNSKISRQFKAVCETWTEVEANIKTHGAQNLLTIRENH